MHDEVDAVDASLDLDVDGPLVVRFDEEALQPAALAGHGARGFLEPSAGVGAEGLFEGAVAIADRPVVADDGDARGQMIEQLGNVSWRHRDGALVLELGQDEERRELIEGAEDHQLLQVQAAVDERDQIAFLRIEVEAVEVRQELGASASDRLQAARMGQEIADDGVADDLDIPAQRQVIWISLAASVSFS